MFESSCLVVVIADDTQDRNMHPIKSMQVMHSCIFIPSSDETKHLGICGLYDISGG